MRLIRARKAGRFISMVSIAGVLVAAGVSPSTARAEDPASKETPAVQVAQQPDETSAVETAMAQGSRVEVAGLRTPTRAVFAEPDGTMTAELNSAPVRVNRNGTWADVDNTLVERPDGSIGPVTTAAELTFSSGGDAPLVRYGVDDAWMELSWPGTLPKPELEQNTATYAQVLPGVDLVLEADADGYAQYLVVESPEAAANPALRTVRLGLATHGIDLHATDAGSLEARDEDGTLRFAAPASIMWDSTMPERHEAAVGVSVDDGALVLRPDPALLDDPATSYPVTIDPRWHTADKHAWTTVLSGSDQPRWNSSGEPPHAQVGHCWPGWGNCNGIGVARTYWLFDTRFLAGKRVLDAHMNVKVVYSPSCAEGQQHELWKANRAITPTTKWSNQPANVRLGSFAPPAVNAQYGCPGYKDAGLLVTSAVNRGGNTAFMIKAADEGNFEHNPYWRKYHNNAQLRVHYNTPPNKPTGLKSDPPIKAPCHWCEGVRYVGDDDIRFQATLTDPDNERVRPLWQVKVGGTPHQARGDFKPNGHVHDHYLDLDDKGGQLVEWAVRAEDGAHSSEWAHGQKFVVDREPPDNKPDVEGRLYDDDNRWHGGVGVEGTFVFDANGVPDVDHFRYHWAGAPVETVRADSLGGGATVRLTPPGDGPQDLYVWSVDRAGHLSEQEVHHFYVRAGNGPLAQWSLDGNATDDAFLGDRDGEVHGDVAYVPGAVGQAIRLNGTDSRVTAPHTVRTDESFSVAAWVRLDGDTYTAAALSQDGTNFAGFDLWYRAESGRWAFGMPRGDEAYRGTDMAESEQPAQVGAWTHLAGVYDAKARTLTLYVNGEPSGTAERTVPDWNAEGSLQIGRTMWNGDAAADHWAGAIDEVRLYDRALGADEVRVAVSSDDVRTGQWKFDELDGTTGRNEVAGGDMMILRNGAAFTGDGDGDGAADGGAVGGGARFDGTDDEAVTTAPAVRTDQSYTVAAWVKATPELDATAAMAVSQDGEHHSGFLLGLKRLESGPVWEFYTPSGDPEDRSGDAVVHSSQPAQLDEWTHLAAVYDVQDDEIRLYVNGQEAGSAAGPDAFDARGALVVGRGFVGEPTAFWSGDVDEVRTYSRVLSEPEIEGVVSRDGVALGAWALDGDATDATANAGHGSLEGAVDWTAGQTTMPDPDDLAASLNGTDAHVSVPNIVDVQQTFSVSAWAKLDDTGDDVAVISQDGQRISAFSVQATSDGHWAFVMFDADADADADDPEPDQVVGPEAQPGVWTHLVGVYDAAASRMSLYVNGVAAGTTAHSQTWSAPGGMQIGAARWRGARAAFFPGAIDDVTVHNRVLFTEEIRTMAGRDLSLTHHWQLDEPSGELAADAVGRRTGTFDGGTRVPGRLGNAVKLDGDDDHMSTSGVDLRTDESFTVSAWVHLEKTCDPGAQFSCSLTAVSLDGEQTSKFRLGHQADQGQNQDGVWVFAMPRSDEGEVAPPAAVTVKPSDFGTWVHLVGVYDAASDQLWLYVNGTRKGDATLRVPWHGTGGLQIGRGLDLTGEPGGFLPGMVDDVRLYTGALDAGRVADLYQSYPEDDGTA